MAPVIDQDDERLKPKPSANAITPCEKYEDFTSKKVVDILVVIARNAERYYKCSSGKDEAILFIETTQEN